MRHGKSFNHLGRTSSHRKAMLGNMACSLIQFKRIETTVAKARALRKFVEPIITRSKADTTHNRRIVFAELQDKESIKELFGTISERVATRPGGYTRIIKLGQRPGDGADMALIELVDFNELLLNTPDETATRTRRSRRRSGGATGESPVAATTAVETVAFEEVAATPAAETTQAETFAEETTQAETTGDVTDEIAVATEAPAEIAMEETSPEASTEGEAPEATAEGEEEKA